MTLVAIGFMIGRGPVSAAETRTDPTEKKLALSLHAGGHDRLDILASVLIDAEKVQSVLMEFADGTLGRAQVAEPGLLNAASRGHGKMELHFGVPKMSRGETLGVVAKLSQQPIEGRGYVWNGEPGQSRRLSCSQCHQGLAIPTAAQLREERQMFTATGKVPPLELPRLLPTSKGEDYRWHKKQGKLLLSTCWECHGRHMVEYEFGQSLGSFPFGAAEGAYGKSEGAPLRSVYHQVFRTEGDRMFSERQSVGNATLEVGAPCGIHYGFERATVRVGPATAPGEKSDRATDYTGVLQQHAAILSEEAGKFMGRHCVLIHWTGESIGCAASKAPAQSAEPASAAAKRKPIAEEERQLTVKNLRARNGSRSLWIDFASKLMPTAGTLHVDGATAGSGFRFIVPIDGGTVAEDRESAEWRAIKFVFEGTTYSAVCFNHPNNPKPHRATVSDPKAISSQSGRSKVVGEIGYSFSADFASPNPLVVHYGLWIQGGTMSSDEIQAMSDDFRDPITIEAK